MASASHRVLDLFRMIPLALAVTIPGFAQMNSVSADPGSVQSKKELTVFKGAIAHATSKGLTLIYGNNRKAATLDADGAFTFSLELQAPTYAELECESFRGQGMTVHLVPGRPLSLTCDTSDLSSTARFTGGGAAENCGLALIHVQYEKIDYGRLFGSNPTDFLVSLRSERAKLEKILSDYAQSHPDLDPGFLRMGRALITYWEAIVRIQKMGLSGDWVDYASKLDFNDPSLLGIDIYTNFQRDYIRARAKERITSDPALKTSINQQTEAQYGVVMETFTNPIIRNHQLHTLLKIQFAGDPEMNWGPLGCKGIEGIMARFDRDCTDKILREDIDRLYRQAKDSRNAPLIRVYKTIGTTTLDAHVFGAKPGEKRPAFLFFHGGGWSIGMPEWGYGHCKRYADKGMVGITFEYRTRLRHGATPADAVADAKSALRWTRVHAGELGIDPNRIVAAGFSAGGHLAGAVGILQGGDDPVDDKTVNASPNAMVLMSAAIDVANDGYFRQIMAGRGASVDYSPAQHVRSGLPPAIVFHGLQDELCSFSLTEAFCMAMKGAGNRCELHTFQGGHFRSGGDWAAIDEKTDEFLTSLGFLNVSPKSPTTSSIR